MVTSSAPVRRLSQISDGVRALIRPPSKIPSDPPSASDTRERQVHAAETRLLYDNVSTGVVATIIIAMLLAYAQRGISVAVVSVWLLYMLLVSATRFLVARWYWRASPGDMDAEPWTVAFVIGAAMAAAGWGAAAILLYSPAEPTHETFLVFVVGGVMLGGASLLAARVEAFLTFLLPTGLVTAVRVASGGDADHLMMGFLCALFTAATVATTWRFHQVIASSFRLRFHNQDLIEHLRTAKAHADDLNRELEFRVSDRTAKLVEADQRKDEFLATLAHELRNPLAPIRFALESLKAGAPAAAAARAREVIDRQVAQLVRLVDDLLDVSRITANKIHLRREPLELARLMATAVESIMPLATAAGHHLDVRMPSTSIYVDGDGARLVQIFANVLNNAVKFTPAGGTISFTVDQQAAEAVVRIRDTGIGIASNALPRVFDMFQQAEPNLERSSPSGLGIGLTLTRRLVEMHDGRIGISSAGIGHGTEVEIRLPIASVQPTSPSVAESPTVGGSRHLRVLIVEDNLDAAEMLEMAVSELGHTTKVAHDGAAAITLATQFVPDVIFLDIGLPVMNGYVVAHTLRNLPEFNSVHIAAVTGWGQEEDRRKAREAGFDSHFTKPLSPAVVEDLLATIAAAPSNRGGLSTPRTRMSDSERPF
jgi:signal transduction histidine kinase/ActR/RegA family two-component response regulator